MAKEIEEMVDRDGNTLGIVYSVTITYVVTATSPCTAEDLAGLVNDRLTAGGGVQADEIGPVQILSVERL